MSFRRVDKWFPGEYVESSPGVYDRTDVKDGSVFRGHSHLHIHFLMTDEEILERGWGIQEFCCHACDETWRYRFDRPTEDQLDAKGGFAPVVHLKEQFTRKHRKCSSEPLNSCPGLRHVVREYQL